jgi:DNA phosphorothioation-associated putative methyltransferase
MSHHTSTTIARHLTALKRNQLSRPVRLALADSIIKSDTVVLDYGCGQGDDVRLLQENGVSCTGWDPFFSQSCPRSPAEVVNLGYVVNVIEDTGEREDALRTAWSLSQRALIVSARLTVECDPDEDVRFGDGYLTSRRTFQKLFEQNELRTWIDSTLNESSVAAAPGVFYVFRDADLKYEYLSSRVRRVSAQPKQRRSDQIFEQHRPLFESLIGFVSTRGRLPVEHELPAAAQLANEIGSIRRAFMIVKRVTDSAQWEKIRTERLQDLLVYMALARFSRRPKFSILPSPLQLDIRSFFSNYSHACGLADRLLFSVGDRALIEQTCRKSAIGKLTPTGLYIHRSALDSLDPMLRVYEGCARALTGAVEQANVVKLYLHEPVVSYLSYPNFESDPHPSLHSSLLVHLQTFELKRRDYSNSDNPPILHRKEQFVRKDDPLCPQYERLTQQEEAKGLYEQPSQIGTRQAWQALLQQKGLRVRGHKLVRVLKRSRQADPMMNPHA